MAHESSPAFRTLHALRIKGFAKVSDVAEIASVSHEDAEAILRDLLGRELVAFREARGLWQLNAAGREHYAAELAADVAGADLAALKEPYHTFLQLNEAFKALCTDWQLVNGAPNDHSDAAHDARVIDGLATVHKAAIPVLDSLAAGLARLAGYAPRLEVSLQRLRSGETNMFTGVMCGSYHDVWMELHEDLILTQGIDRAAEGSF
jgi:cytochrome c5